MGFFLLLLYLTACYIRPADFFPELAAYRPMMWFAIITAFFVLFDSIRGGLRFWAPQYYLMAAFMGAVALSRVAQGWIGGAILAVLDFSVPFAIFYCVALSITSMRRQNILAGFVIISFLGLAVQSLIGFADNSERFFTRQSVESPNNFSREFSHEDEEYMGDEASAEMRPLKRIRSIGFLNDPNDFAQALLVALPLLAHFWRPGGGLRNFIFVVIPGILLLVTIYLTHSRGALVGILALALLWIYQRFGKGVAFAGVVIVSAAVMIAKLATVGSSSLDLSSYGRIDAWGVGLELLKAQPLLGAGYNFFTEHNELTAHNSFVLCFSELGLIGYFFWLAILIITVAQLAKIFRNGREAGEEDDASRWALTLMYALLAFLATSFFLSRTYVITLYLLLGMSAALFIYARSSPSPVSGPRLRDWLTWTSVVEVLSIALIYFVVRAGRSLGPA